MMNDILLNEDFELDIQSGDFVAGRSNEQHQQLLLLCFKGDYKENPTICVGAAGYLKDENKDGLLQEAKQQFQKDGMTVNKVKIDADDKILIDARY